MKLFKTTFYAVTVSKRVMSPNPCECTLCVLLGFSSPRFGKSVCKHSENATPSSTGLIFRTSRKGHVNGPSRETKYVNPYRLISPRISARRRRLNRKCPEMWWSTRHSNRLCTGSRTVLGQDAATCIIYSDRKCTLIDQAIKRTGQFSLLIVRHTYTGPGTVKCHRLNSILHLRKPCYIRNMYMRFTQTLKRRNPLFSQTEPSQIGCTQRKPQHIIIVQLFSS